MAFNAFRTLALQWNGSTWSIAASGDTSSTRDNFLEGVNCKSPSWCMAVGGAYNGAGAEQPMTQLWNGSSFSIVPTASPGTTHDAEFDGVSCPSQSDCFAVGFQEDPAPVNTTLTERWNGSSWSIVSSPTTAGTFSESLASVSCIGPTSCTAVGQNETSRTPFRTDSVAETWNGSSWALQAPPNPVGAEQTALFGVSCVSGHSCTATGQATPAGDTSQTVIESAPIVRPGYRFVASDGGVFNFGGASFNGSHGGQALNKPIVGMASTPDGGGYWLVASDGGVFSYGDAVFYGSTGGTTLNKPVVGMASTPDGGGYWLVASDGGVFSYGDAKFFGSTGNITLNQPIVGMAATPSGQGYWLVASDGGVFSFGDAKFHGSTGAIALKKPVVGMSASPSGNGYWLVASDGGVFSFGDALFHGSAGALVLNRPVVGMAPTSSGKGYWLVASDGGVFSYGDALFHGSTGNIALNQPIVGMGA